jgi:dihydropteroate synthase
MLMLPRNRTLLPRRRPAVMGILNVTPDSFSDGGQFASTDAAIARGLAMLAEGADIIDVGAESTRPGSHAVTSDEQVRRALPVIAALRHAQPDAVISIDTRSADVAGAALTAGADIVNDISALRGDARMLAIIARAEAAVVLMHMQGEPATMQLDPAYADVVREVGDFLRTRAVFAESCGVARRCIVLDPGIGFGKTRTHNLALLRELEILVATGYPVLLGASRKGFLAAYAADGTSPDARLGSSLACVLRAREAGAAIVRVHDVADTCQFLDALDHLQCRRTGP